MQSEDITHAVLNNKHYNIQLIFSTVRSQPCAATQRIQTQRVRPAAILAAVASTLHMTCTQARRTIATSQARSKPTFTPVLSSPEGCSSSRCGSGTHLQRHGIVGIEIGHGPAVHIIRPASQTLISRHLWRDPRGRRRSL